MLVKTKNYVYFGDTGGKECKVNMKRIIKLVIVMTLCMVMIGCQRKEKNVYTETYTLKYFYVEGCSNCEYFTKNGLPLIKEEFGDHMKIIKYNMDDQETVEDVKRAYNEIVDNIIDFNQDDYGFGPFLVLEDYFAQLGVDNVDDFLENLIKAINDKELGKPKGSDTYYYFKDGKIKEE